MLLEIYSVPLNAAVRVGSVGFLVASTVLLNENEFENEFCLSRGGEKGFQIESLVIRGHKTLGSISSFYIEKEFVLMSFQTASDAELCGAIGAVRSPALWKMSYTREKTSLG